MINYISNLDPGNHSGGWNGINYQLLNAMRQHGDIHFCGPVNVPVSVTGKAGALIKAKLTGRKTFYFFSGSRLTAIAAEVDKLRSPMAVADFFFGPTSWIQCRTPRKYFVFTDLAFPDYLENYIGTKGYDPVDIQRIYNQEQKFLDGAAAVFFTSKWASENAKQKLGLKNPSNHQVVRVAGNISIPDTDTYSYVPGHPNLLFISLNFEKKGGMACYQAFLQVQEAFPEARLNIVGQEPPAEVLAHPGVVYHGRLNKENAEDLATFKKILAEASFLVHPTKMDATPTVIAEAAYFGCPAIAPAHFGIPDLVRDTHTGFLLHTDNYVTEIAGRVITLFGHKDQYLAMRKAAREFAIKELSWQGIAERIAAVMSLNQSNG